MDALDGRLSQATLSRLPAAIRRPAYDRERLKTGILHLGPGAFHRAHQNVFTEDAIAAAGGDWGVTGVSLRSAALSEALAPQDGLYAVETLGEGVRVVGVVKRVLFAPASPGRVLAAFADPNIHVVTLTITEAGYALAPDGKLDLAHPDIVHDLRGIPVSALGWLVTGLAARRRAGGEPITVISCDNLSGNGAKLAAAVRAFADRADPTLGPWLEASVAFPSTMVDCIVPATDAGHRARVEAALGLEDAASVQREAFAAWAIEDRFAGPRPAWEAAGAEIVASVEGHERLKLHVLNATHSALAYLGLPRGLSFVRQAIADPELAAFAEAMVGEEIAPALAGLDVAGYWAKTRARLANPSLDHRLAQIAEDGSAKLAQRIFPILIANARAGRPAARLAAVIRAWLDAVGEGRARDPQGASLAAWLVTGGDLAAALDDPVLFPEPFRAEPLVRLAALAPAA
ncbi:MAG TPA: mannitol dehydrogenase family protein [Caulobacteraceae bacterium]